MAFVPLEQLMDGFCHLIELGYNFDVKSIIILYDDTKVFERHHVALKINNRLH